MGDITKKVNICRVCLNTDAKKCMSLFETFKDSFIFDHINLITNVQITRHDRLPDKICPSCLLELEVAVNFKQKCVDSNIILQASSSEDKLEVDIKEIIIKKEEAEEIGYLDEDYNFINCPTIDVDSIKPEGPVTGGKSKDSKLVCHDCGNLFKSKCKLNVHWKKVHLPEILVCDTCKRKFKSFKALNRHKKHKSQSCATAENVNIRGEGKSRWFHCKDCDYNTRRIKDMKAHLLIHSGERPYQCKMCHKAFSQQSSLDSHKESAHKMYKVEVTCQYCGKYIKGRTKVYKHLRTHTEPMFQCDVCKKMLKSKSTLVIHIARHSGVKSYTCEICAQSFFSSAELCNHKRNVHMKGKYWYSCDLCEYKSVKSSIIKKHKEGHATDKLPCTVCGMFLENEQKLLLHQRRHFEEKKYSCPHCDKKFYRRDSIGKHVRTKHKCKMLLQKRNGLNVKKEFPVITPQYEDIVEVEITELTD